MNTEEIVAFFVQEAPRYNSLPKEDRKFYQAILQTLPSTVLEEVEDGVRNNEDNQLGLLYYIRLLKINIDHGESIDTLLRWYKNKKSKKVSYAYNRLCKRYKYEGYNVQKKIIGAFLLGGKKSSEWAALRLRDNWIPGLDNEIKAAWKSHEGQIMANVILKMMPAAYVMQEQDKLLKSASNLWDAYAVLCGRLIKTPGFVMDETKLSIPGWFYVMSLSNAVKRIPEMDEKVDRFIREQKRDDYVGYEDRVFFSPLSYVFGIKHIVRAMKQLHYVEGLLRLARLDRQALDMVNRAGMSNNRVAAAIECLQVLVKDDLPE